MQKSDYQKLHHELWQWLADNPGKEKYDWPRWEFNGGCIEEQKSDCFACGYFTSCIRCELNRYEKKISGKNMCKDEGVYQRWRYLDDYETRTKLALHIKDLW